jgi:asparagine synthase (glutamine-hydrolysing)
MCGIAGRFHPQQLPPDPRWLAEANRRLAHRGPDGEGVFRDEHCELAHRRLALLDLSPTGHQPMSNADGSIWITYNGEVYNHPELRRELESRGYRFRGTSDTEVLVYLYEEFGAQMVERLRGMFAFAIYDQRRRSLLLARDRFGIKPLYYAALGNQFVFASEIKAILALDGFSPTLDRQACFDFLGLSYVPEPMTAFAEIRALPPGHTLTITNGQPQLREYFRLETQVNETAQLPAVARQTSEALLQAVAAQSVADVPVAALLSGGIDSSLVVAAYCQTSAKSPTTFNVSFPDQSYDETPVALAVSERYGTQHQTITSDDWKITPELVQRLLLHFDQPFADSSLIPTFRVSQAIRESGIICALSGDGGDEAFGGYDSFSRANRFARLMQLPGWLQSTLIRGADALRDHTQDFGRQIAKAVRLAQLGERDGAMMLAGMSNYISEEQKTELALLDAFAGLQPAARHFDGFLTAGIEGLEDLSHRLTETHFTVNLTSDMLRKVDMMSMLASIEVRVPMLDEEVVAAGLALPHRLKTDGQTGKLVLRDIARGWLPDVVTNHRKMGFRIPLDRMVTPQFHELLADLLLASSTRSSKFLNRGVVEKWLRQFQQAQTITQGGAISREGLYQRIIILLALELWMREHHLNW